MRREDRRAELDDCIGCGTRDDGSQDSRAKEDAGSRSNGKGDSNAW